MSFFPGKDPAPGDKYQCDALKAVIVPRTADLGDGFTVRRALPSAQSRMVGPFVFFDHFGPAVFRSGNGLDVRPHPHIGLATVTYLFDGEIMHRDSLGTAVPIRPGEVNWMTAGRGIVHSERTGAGAPRQRRQPARPADVGGAAGGEGGDGAGLRASCGRRISDGARQRQDRARGGRLAPTASARRSTTTSETLFADAHAQGRQHAAARRRSRGARDLRARRRDRDRGRPLRRRTGCWCSSPATASPSAR